MDTARYVEKITTILGKILASIQPDAEAESAGLTPAQLQGMSYLYHHGKSSIGELAHGLDITHPAAVRLVDRLSRKGLIERSESETDRRISLISLTEDATSLAHEILERRTRTLAQALTRLEPGELGNMMRGLESLLSAMLEDRMNIESVCLKCGDDHIGCCIVNRTHLELTGANIENT